jgi:hemoglobin
MDSRSQEAPEHVFVPPAGPPQGPGPNREIHARMGEAAIFRMCEDFYRALEATPIRPMFPDDMPAASKKLAAFLVQLFGGPPLFVQLYGPPRMRARHLPFAIDEAARRAWLDTFKGVLADAPAKYGFPPEHLPGFVTFLEEFSAWMVNRAPSR